MTEKHKSQTEDPEVAIQSAIGRVEGFIMNNGRSLLTALIVVVVVVGGFFGYKYLISGPRAEKAAAMMFVAEQQFAVDSFALALNGDGNFAGFLEVIDRYGSTDEGNLARHYAGICYLRLGEYQQALDYLKEYSASTKSVPEALLAAQNCGLQGDAYAQLENYAEAVRMYEKAVAASDNSLSAPYYLKRREACTRSSAITPRPWLPTRGSATTIPPAWRRATYRSISGVSSSRCKADAPCDHFDNPKVAAARRQPFL